MTEKDLEIQQLRRENEYLRRERERLMAINGIPPMNSGCFNCKHQNKTGEEEPCTSCGIKRGKITNWEPACNCRHELKVIRTNLDRIRGMSAEELGNFLYGIADCCSSGLCLTCDIKCKVPCTPFNITAWLNEEVRK